METSTPVHRKANLRRSLLTSAMIASPLRGKTVGGESPVVLLERTDDEKERSTRRSMVAMQRRLTNITPNASPATELNQIIEESQIKDHIRICTKLYTENKISTKNAWELHIIDIIRKMTSVDDNANVLQVAGSSLDIGAKIYGFRVDDVHTRGLKLASSMAKSNENQAPQDPEDDNNQTRTQNKRNAGAKKKKKLTGDKKNTVDKEGKSLFAPLVEMESVMFSTKENIEVSATDNLFTCKLGTNPGNHLLMLMSQEKYWSTSPDLIQQHNGIIDIEMPNVTEFIMCQPFNDFVMSDWDPDEEEKQLANIADLNNVLLDDNGLPIAELDGSIHNIFENGADNPEEPVSDEEILHEEFQAQIHGEVAHIVDALPEENRIETDYGYNTLVRTSTGKFIDRIWAGPSHWKVKFNRRSALRFSGSVQQVVARCTRKAKVYEPVNFDIVAKDTDHKEKLVIKRAPPSVSFEKITLPAPELTAKSFHKQTDELLSKPGVLRPKPRSTSRETQDYEVQVYNYENPTDAQYCSQNSIDEREDNEPLHHSFDEDGAAATQQNFLDENLVNAPEMVPTSQIHYAMQAKKMDMKKLKSAVWKLLTQNTDGQENDANRPKIKPTKFSTLYRELPNFLSADMKKELSSPLAFAALLHLCNENNLELVQDPNYKDFTIMKAKE